MYWGIVFLLSWAKRKKLSKIDRLNLFLFFADAIETEYTGSRLSARISRLLPASRV